MSYKPKLDLDKLATQLGAERRGEVTARGGHFGAVMLVREVQERFYPPATGGRATDPAWTERRLIPLSPETLERLERLATRLSEQGRPVSPLQVAALILEKGLVEAESSGNPPGSA